MTDGSLSLSINDQYVLSVVLGDGHRNVILDDSVAEENWPPAAWSDEYRDFTLTDDATEAVAEAAGEVLEPWGASWPTCIEHHRPLDVCGTTWVCGKGHDLAPVGDLRLNR